MHETTAVGHTVAHRVVRRLVTLAVAATVAVAGLAVPAALQVAPAQAAASTSAMPDDFDGQVLYFTNLERTERGLSPLRAATCVDGFAARHTKTLAKKNRMYHQKLRPIMRKCDLRRAGENLAWRAPSMSAQQVVRMWMDSPGHRKNILNRHYKTIGIDAFKNERSGRIFAGQVFGS